MARGWRVELELDGAVDGHHFVSASCTTVHAFANAECWVPSVHGVGYRCEAEAIGKDVS